MNHSRCFRRSVWPVFCTLGCLVLLQVQAAGTNLTLDLQLIWATNDTQSSNPDHKPIDPDLAKKLGKAPYKWNNYFLIGRQTVEIPAGQGKKGIKLSDHCSLDMKNLGEDRVEALLYGEGKPVSKHVEKLTKDWPVVFGGDAKNNTAWLVVIQKLDSNGLKPQKLAPK
jgi:hypothetical protein